MRHWISRPDLGEGTAAIVLAAAILAALIAAALVRPPALNRLPLPERIQAMLAASPELLPAAGEFETLEAVLSSGGVDEAWQWLNANYTTVDGAIMGKPYFLALRIGDHLYETRGLAGLAGCVGHKAACYHGLIGRAITDRGRPMAAVARAACAEVTNGRGEYLSCIHAIGHGLAAAHNFNLTPALAVCDELDQPEQEPCGDGVFMEYLFSAPSSSARTNDPWYPCTAVPQRYGAACARRQASVMRFKLGLPTPAIASACLAAPDSALSNPCLDGIGRYAGFISAGDMAMIRTTCAATASPRALERCTFSGALELALDNYPGADAGAAALCTELPTALRTECRERLEWIKQSRYEQDNLY